MNGQKAIWGAFEEFSVSLRERREQASVTGNSRELARFGAMEAVMNTKLIPLACPDAVTIAGDAAQAAHEGCGESDWYAEASARCNGSADERMQFNTAVRLLKLSGLWPWCP